MNKMKLVTMAMLSVAVGSSWAAKETIVKDVIVSRSVVDESLISNKLVNGAKVTDAIAENGYTFSVCTRPSNGDEITCGKTAIPSTSNRRTFRWQKFDPSYSSFSDYSLPAFSDGVYRLVAEYSIFEKSLLGKNLACIDGLSGVHVDYILSNAAVVGGLTFDRVDSVSTYYKDGNVLKDAQAHEYTQSCDSVLTTFKFASEPMTVGKAGALYLKPVCLNIKKVEGGKMDTTVVEGCGVKYSYEEEYRYENIYVGDNLWLDLESTNPEFGFSNKAWEDSSYSEGKFVAASKLTRGMTGINSSTYFGQKPGVGDDTVTIYMENGHYKVSYELSLTTAGSVDDAGSVEAEAFIYGHNYHYGFVEVKDGYRLSEVIAQYESSETGSTVTLPSSKTMLSNGAYHGKYGKHVSINVDGVDNDLTVYVKYAPSGNAVNLTLTPSENADYTITSGDYVYESAETEKSYLSGIAGSKITAKAVAKDGFYVAGAKIKYNNGTKDVETLVDVKEMVKDTANFEILIPSASSIKNDATNGRVVSFELVLKTVSVVAVDIDGLAKTFNLVDASTENILCSIVSEGVVQDGECKIKEGTSVSIISDTYAGHPFNELKCLDGDNKNLGCSKSSAKFTMPAIPVTVTAEFEATEYNLTKDVEGLYGSDYSFYNADGKKINTAHARDTIYVKSDKDDLNFDNITFGNITSAGIDVKLVHYNEFYFVMPAQDVIIAAGQDSVHNIIVKNIGGDIAITKVRVILKSITYVEANVASSYQEVRLGTEAMFDGTENKTGYELDSVYCDNGSDEKMTKLVLKSSGLYSFEMANRDVTCEVYSHALPYSLEWKVADENGSVKTPKIGDKAYDKDENPAKTDDEVSFDVQVLKGYTIDFVTVYFEDEQTIGSEGDDGEVVIVKTPIETTVSSSNNVYTYKFTMPARDVKIEANFKEIPVFTITYKFDKEEVTEELEEGAMPTAPAKFTCPEKTAEFTYSCAWDKDFAKVTEAATYTYKATATKNKYTVAVKVNDSKMGSVKGAGEYEYGTEVELVATAAEGYKFSNWKDDAKAAATRKVTVKEAVELTANFEKLPESSSSKTEAIFAAAQAPKFSLSVAGRNVQIAGAHVGSAYAILDMQGRVMTTGSVESANFSVALPRSGSYMVRVGSQTQRVNVR